VDINISLDSCVPPCSLPGHAWQSVRHDPLVTWLCGWHENVQQQHKYVMLAASSSFKGKSDFEKYNKAIRLTTRVDAVRKNYTAKIKSKSMEERQLGTAMWVIDVLALRVGGEKGEDEADTVGCCTVRKEHLTFSEDPDSSEIELKFLGKDSMLYQQTINFAIYGDLGKLVYKNLKAFCKGKSPSSDVFDTLNPSILNKHLTSIMPGLTAKVFRTYNASITLEKELPSAEAMKGLSIQEKLVMYNAANRQVAILCNHQKTVSKAAEVMFENLNEKLENLNSQRRELVSWLELAKKKKASKIPLKKDDSKLVDKIVAAVKDAQARKETARTDEEKLSAAADLEVAKAKQKEDQKRRFQQKHMYKQEPTAAALEAKIAKWGVDIRKMETDIRNRDENKDVALGTSKINYMDPRISVAWCKRNEVPIDKVFAKTLREKFNWACAVPPDWKFEPH
jgi:DNA topoisomerase-1